MNTRTTALIAGVSLWLMAGTALCASPDMASALVKDASHRMLVTLEKRRAEVDRDSTLIYKMVQEILVPHFDFERITQGRVRRSRLYYLRSRRGKAARIRERGLTK